MMRRSQSGAAQVSFLWIVFLVVLVLFLAGFTYIAWKDKGDSDRAKTAAEDAAKQATDRAVEARQEIIELSEVAGFRDETEVGSRSDVEAMNDKIDILKGRFPNHIASDVSNLEATIDGIVNYSNMVKRELDEKTANLETEIRTRQEAQGAIQNIEQQKNARIQELNGMLSDEQQRSAQQKEEDNQRIANLQSQLDELNNRMREVEATAELDKQVAAKEISTLQARLLAQAQKLEVLEEPDLPDGRIVAVSPEAGLAYVDIGGQDGLRRGTKFDVYRYGKGGELVRKGRVEVRDVETESAICGILEEVNALDPIVVGDQVLNPLFSRDLKRTFVLLGRFPTSMNRALISERLVALGNGVEETVSARTDFLVLGDKEQGEFAPELTETDEYKLADRLGVQIVKLNDIWDFIKY
jgi:hypothetical protein